jgi:hypothetical protein
MLRPVDLGRLTAATLVCSVASLGSAFVLGNGSAQTRTVEHTCSVADKQFLQTVSSNMVQLGYWSDSLGSGDATPAVVVHQAKAEAEQVEATRPTDPTLSQTRQLLRVMFVEYGRAIYAKYHGGNAGKHMGAAYTFANDVHALLVDAQPALAGKGCDVSPLFNTT